MRERVESAIADLDDKVIVLNGVRVTREERIHVNERRRRPCIPNGGGLRAAVSVDLPAVQRIRRIPH